MDFISDITKEIIKDVNAQKIVLYPISELKTKAHGVYDEAIKKIFDHPIIIEALVDNSFEKDTVINQFGIDKNFKIEVFVHYRDMVERGITPCIGDYFTFSDVVFEITEARIMRNIYGQAEHADGMRIVGTPAREGSIELMIKGPTDIQYTDPDAIQKTFHQQRGFETNADGKTEDFRDMVKKGVLEPPITGPKTVSPLADEHDRNAFYDED
jgi:hypothetical protein